MNNKTLIKGIPAVLMLGIIYTGLFFGCQSQSGNLSLGPKPQATFTMDSIPNKTNMYLFTSTTKNAFIWEWNVGDGSGWKKGGSTDTAYYAQKGTYTVALRVFTKGGYDTTSQSVVVLKDDPNGCFGNKALLTGCASKTWILDPSPGALWIGTADFATTWWANTQADLTIRSCQFDNEYTFHKDGSFDFNNNGDIWVDADSGIDPYPIDIIANNPNDTKKTGCYPWSDINTKYAAWGSGTFNYTITGSSITVIGLGAHLGLYKAGETNTTPVPESSINYKIISMTNSKLVIAKIYDWGAWQFTFVPKP